MAKKSTLSKTGKTFTGPALLWKRMAAFLIDLLIIDFVILGPFNKIFEKLIPAKGFSETLAALQQQPEVVGLFSTLALLMGVLMVLYFSLFESKLGQSVGKMLLKIRVVGEKGNPSFWRCVVRSLFIIPVFPFILIFLIDVVYLFFNKESRRLLEVLSKTRTVQDFNLGDIHG